MPKRKAPNSRTDATPRDTPRGELVKLRAKLAAAEASARACAEAERRMGEELEVYQEEAAQQTRQLVEANEALETSHARYVSLYDYAPVAFVSLDHNGVIDDLNLAAADLLGAERERLMKHPLLNFVHVDSRRPFLDHMVRCRRREVPAKTEITMRPRRGGDVPVLLATWFGVPRGGPGWEFRSALLDLTDRKAAEAHEAQYQKRLSSLASELSLAEERERRRIAVEIHDNLSQNLALIKMKLGMLRQKAALDDVHRGLSEVSALLDPVLERTRSLTFELSPPVLYELGLEAALEWLGERFGQQNGLEVRVVQGPGPRDRSAEPVPHNVAVLVFTAVRELLMNIVKHASARRVTVRFERGAGSLVAAVTDDGRGFDPSKLGHAASRVGSTGNGARAAKVDSGGFGLFSIRTRLEHMGGRMDVRSEPGAGTEITLTVPLGTPAGADGHAPRGGAPWRNLRYRDTQLDHPSPGPNGSRGQRIEPPHGKDRTHPSMSHKRSEQ